AAAAACPVAACPLLSLRAGLSLSLRLCHRRSLLDARYPPGRYPHQYDRVPYPCNAVIAIPGTFSQLGLTSMSTSRRAIWWVRRLSKNQAGFGLTVSGPRTTDFSTPPSMYALCTQPRPL